MEVATDLRFAIALCFVAGLELNQAGLFRSRAKKIWPSDEDEIAGLGSDKIAFEQFCLNARDEIKRTLGESDVAGKVLTLMSDFSNKTGESLERIRMEVYQKHRNKETPDQEIKNEINQRSTEHISRFFVDTLGRLVRDKLQVGAQLVCNAQTMIPLRDGLLTQLEEYKRTRKTPAKFDRVRLIGLGCKSGSRLWESIIGCNWFMKMSLLLTPYIASPHELPGLPEEFNVAQSSWQNAYMSCRFSV